MGCKQSNIRGDNSFDGRLRHVNPDHLPAVPGDCWYAQRFTEESPMDMTEYHSQHKGRCVFSDSQIPTRSQQLEKLPDKSPLTRTTFILGEDSVFGMGYLHNTALYIEHYWRTRVQHPFPGDSKFDRPFYNMLLGVRVFINDQLVPDQVPQADSLLQCTTTIHAHEATTTWLCVPFVLSVPPTALQRTLLLTDVVLYRDLVLSFATAASTLHLGEHTVRTEVVYGCRAEGNFVTDFIARGTFSLIVDSESSSRCLDLVAQLTNLKAAEKRQQKEFENGSVLKPKSAARLQQDLAEGKPHVCAYCGAPLKYVCAICAASVCGSTACVWSKFVGYPWGCQTHRAVD